MALIDTTNLDAGTDKIKLARPAILAMANWLNGMMGSGSDPMVSGEKSSFRTILGVIAKAGDLFTGVVRAWYKGDNTITTTSSFTYDPPTHGQVALITLTNAIAVTFGAPSNVVEGSTYKIMLKAGDASARSFAWNAAYKFPSATAPLTAGTATTGGIDAITFIGGASNTLIYDGHSADIR